MGKNIFNNWSIEKGDYKRDITSSIRHERKNRIKKIIKKTLFTLLYLSAIALITYLILNN